MIVIGIIGLSLMMVAWIAETVDLIKKKESKLDMNFAVFSIIGSILLLIYSIQIKNIIFIIMKSVVIILICISMFYSLKLHKL